MTDIILIIAAYLIGSFPSSLIIGKVFYQTDIREHGSGNLGATNAHRVLGAKGGLAVFFLDIFKGFAAMWLAQAFGQGIHPIIIAIFAIIGHIYPVFANFRGGKAVATTGGIIIFLAPWHSLGLIILFIITLAIWKMVSLSSTILALAVIAMVWLTPGFDRVEAIFLTLFACLVILKHTSNYKRILNGTENKFAFKKKI